MGQARPPAAPALFSFPERIDMKSVALAAAACLALPLGLVAQDWIEVRFDRVHLKNGNFIDGRIIARNDLSVTMQIVGGEITFKYGTIDRIEVVKMKDIKQKEVLIEKPKTPVGKTPDDPSKKT